jgi:two-component system response regulator NreC
MLMTGKLLSVLLADDHRMLREGIRALLVQMPEVGSVADVSNGRDAVQVAIKDAPDIIVMDVAMPDLNGIDATRQICAHRPDAKVIGLSMHSDSHLILEMLKAGASAYLLKDCAFDEMSSAIHAIQRGRRYLSPEITNTVVGAFMEMRGTDDLSLFSLLSAREREVLHLLVEAKGTTEIASTLCISVKTVESHRQQISRKTGCHSLVDLVKFALREGITHV